MPSAGVSVARSTERSIQGIVATWGSGAVLDWHTDLLTKHPADLDSENLSSTAPHGLGASTSVKFPRFHEGARSKHYRSLYSIPYPHVLRTATLGRYSTSATSHQLPGIVNRHLQPRVKVRLDRLNEDIVSFPTKTLNSSYIQGVYTREDTLFRHSRPQPRR